MWVFFFFKQKTAYEMRISDWSSDVCSSDLRLSPGCARIAGAVASIRPVRLCQKPDRRLRLYAARVGQLCPRRTSALRPDQRRAAFQHRAFEPILRGWRRLGPRLWL